MEPPSYLTFVPTQDRVHAVVRELSPEMIAQGIGARWWTDAALKAVFEVEPIDRHWDWNAMPLEVGGRVLEAVKVGVLTDDGYVQGAMMMSREGVASGLEPGASCLWVELLFTAPRNRRGLRVDGRKYFADVGTELLRWAVDYSVRQGCGGRLRLEASPAYTEWYRAIGFAALPIEAVEFEGVQYVPMELAGVGGQLRDQAQEVSNGQKS